MEQIKDLTVRMNLYQKLAKIRSIADAVKKDRSGYNYKYSDLEEILPKVTAGMNKYGVSLLPSVVPGTKRVYTQETRTTKFTKDGKPYEAVTTEWVFDADFVFTWVNDDNPEERINVDWNIVGAQSDPSQAFGSGLTYCTRYFLKTYFQIGETESDPDTYRSKQKAAEESENKKIAKEIIDSFDTKLKVFLTECDADKKAEVQAFIGKYVKGSEYRKITDPAIAAKLLSDFESKYLKGEDK